MKKLAILFTLSLLLVLAVLAVEAGPPTGEGPTSGAIFTTTPDGSIVNENVRYQSKLEVYLDGGPGPNAPQTAAGLPDDFYVFQVTDPSGKVLLSQDPAKCRIVRVQDGIIQELVAPSDLVGMGLSDVYTVGNGGNAQTFPCHIQDDPDGAAGASGRHDTNTDTDYGNQGAIVVQLMPFLDTPNPGGVYKAWVLPLLRYQENGGDLDEVPWKEEKHKGEFLGFERDPGFGPPRDEAKTDNFKVKEVPPIIHVHKYEDLNGNGMLDPGEPELEGWEILITETLYDGSTVTNRCWTPCWEEVAPNSTVTVTEVVPEGWEPSFIYVDGTLNPADISIDVVFAPGDTEHTVEFGNFETPQKSGYKFHDRNADGDRDAGEEGLNGWKIVIEGKTGAGEDYYAEAMTDDDADGNPGYYEFNPPPGTYTVSEVCPTDETWFQSKPAPADGCGSGVYDIELASGDVDDDNDFGNYQNATKAGYKFHDLNGNGQYDEGEPSLPNWTIHLFGQDGQGNPVNRTAKTDGNGYYSFDVAPGQYVVCEILPSTGWIQSYPATGHDCSQYDTDTITHGPVGYAITLESQEIDDDNHFGNFQNATKAGKKFHDLNGNGQYDDGEPGLPDWKIHLFGKDGMDNDVSLFATTDGDGDYSFSVPPGHYTVCEILEDGWYQSYPGSGVDCSQYDNAVTHGPVGYDVPLVSQQVDDDNHFGNFQPVFVMVHKFFDGDGDGIRDDNEAWLDGFEFCLYDAGGELVSADDFASGVAQPACAFTDENGIVLWTDLLPGTYTVKETLPPGWFSTITTVWIGPLSGPYDFQYPGATEVTVTLDSGGQAHLFFGNFANCVGLTPGYWKNWRNHYTEEQILILLEGTIAPSTAEADAIFADYDASDPSDLTILKAFTLANQLTLNLTQHPELPNPDDASLIPVCMLRDYPDAPSLGEALDEALAIINGEPATDEYILHIKDLLDKYANQDWRVTY